MGDTGSKDTVHKDSARTDMGSKIKDRLRQLTSGKDVRDDDRPEELRIMFMGTPDFSAVTLDALIEAGENVCAVVTAPDKPRGRGMELAPSPVKVRALSSGIRVVQPLSLKGEDFLSVLSELDPNLIIVVAYGKKLPDDVLAYPRCGCINIHASLLPAYRGAAPIQRAIMNGEKKTGVTIIKMASGIDCGDMLFCREVDIGPDDDFETVHDRLAEAGAIALFDTLSLIRKNALVPEKQDESQATYAAKIEKSDCALDFSKSAAALHDTVRALSPAPLAYTRTPDGKLLKIVAASVCVNEYIADDGVPGTILGLGRTIDVRCGEGALSLETLIPEGKGRMSAADYVRGRKLRMGDILSSLD